MKKEKLSDMIWATVAVFVVYSSLIIAPLLIKTSINIADKKEVVEEKYIYEVEYESDGYTRTHFYTIEKSNLIKQVKEEKNKMNYYTDDHWVISEINLIN